MQPGIPDEQVVSGHKSIEVYTCRPDDNFIADTGDGEAIQMDTSGYNLYLDYMYQVETRRYTRR